MNVTEARAALVAARHSHDTIRTANASASSWDRSLAALGNEPVVDAEPVAPKPPPGERPTAEAIAKGKATLEASTRAAGAQERHAAQLAQAKRAVEVATTQAEDAAASVAHHEALVVACREAPGRVLAQQQAALGDTGTVALDFTGTGVEVKIRGNPWDGALKRPSDGQLVEGDLFLRGALRRLGKLGWCHLFVDNRQAWSGALPDVGGKVIVLRTGSGELRTDGEGA